MKKRIRIFTVLLACCLAAIGLSVIYIFVIGFLSIFGFSSSIETQTTIEKYRTWTSLHGGLACFPETLTNMDGINEYYCRIDHPLSFGTPEYEIFLDITYSKSDYEKEVARLSTMEYKSSNFPETRSLKYDNAVLFHFPTYIAAYDQSDYDYEYACLDEENYRLIYVYIQIMNYEEVQMEEVYRPKHLEINGNDDTSDGYYYSLYYYPAYSDEQWYSSAE
jgi:hypothetical protein